MHFGEEKCVSDKSKLGQSGCLSYQEEFNSDS